MTATASSLRRPLPCRRRRRRARRRRAQFANLDYAATAPVPRAAADAVNELLPWYASVHRGAGALSQRCTAGLRTGPADRRRLRRLPRRRPRGLHPQHHRRAEPAGPGAARRAPRWSPSPASTTPTCCPGRARCGCRCRTRRRRGARGRRGAARAAPGRHTPPILVAVTGAATSPARCWPVAAARRGRAPPRRPDRGRRRPTRPAPPGRPRPRSASTTWRCPGTSCTRRSAPGCSPAGPTGSTPPPPYLAGGGATADVGDATHDVALGDRPRPARGRHPEPARRGRAGRRVPRRCDRADRAALAAHEQALLARLRDGLAALPGVRRAAHCSTRTPTRVGIVRSPSPGRTPPTWPRYLAARHGIGVRDGLFCAHPLARRLLLRGGRTARPTAAGDRRPGQHRPGHHDRARRPAGHRAGHAALLTA